MIPFPSTAVRRIFILVILASLLTGMLQAAVSAPPRRAAAGSAMQLDGVLQENALYFSTLTGLAVTLSISKPIFGFRVENINMNLLSRYARDAAGRQKVVCRLGGAVRSNNNVEMDVLDAAGTLVGRMFYGAGSGDLFFYDANNRLIIRGFLDGSLRFSLSDLRLESAARDLGWGRFHWYWDMPGFEFYWYDRNNQLLSGGYMPFWPEGDYTSGLNRIRARWVGLDGTFSDGRNTELEAEYDMRREVTGAVNSNLFDLRGSAASFFQHPYDLLSESPGLAWLPRVTNSTRISIANHAVREARIVLTARRYDGSLLRGAGIVNPVAYRFAPGQQYAAGLADFFTDAPDSGLPPPLLPPNALPVWMEIAADQAEISATYGDTRAEEIEFLPAGHNARQQLFLDGLRSATATQTELSILNPSYTEGLVSMRAYDAAGMLLSSTDQFYIPARGFRNFFLGALPELFPGIDGARIATLRAESPANGPGLTAVLLRNEKQQFEMARDREDSEGAETLWVPFFIVGERAGERWDTRLTVSAGTALDTLVQIESFSLEGSPLFRREWQLRGNGSLTLQAIDLLPAGVTGVVRGYLRISGTSRILGSVSYGFSTAGGGAAAGLPLSPRPFNRHTFQEIFSGRLGGERYYSGLALLNPLEVHAAILVQALADDGSVRAEVTVNQGPLTGKVLLLEELFGADFSQLGGRLRLRCSSPVYALGLTGNDLGTRLSAIPATEIR